MGRTERDRRPWEAEFTEFAGARWRHLVHAGILLGCSPAEAEDLAQTTLLRCYVAWPKVQRAESREAYVSRMLLNGFRSSRRRRWWGERPTERLPEQTSPDPTHEVDGADAVERALGGLVPAQREVVVLRYWSHLSVQQIADVLGVAEGTVKSRLSRALDRLAADSHIADLFTRRS